MKQGTPESEWVREIDNLILSLRCYGVDLRKDASEKLLALAHVIFSWNQRINLISRRDIKRLISYHFADSASILPILNPGRNLEVLDIGGSNGLPGLVLHCLSPHLEVTICDPRVSRHDFLQEACRAIGKKDGVIVDTVHGESFQSQYREYFDLIVARAVTRLRRLVKASLPVLKPGGCIIAYKGSRCKAEVEEATKYFFTHQGMFLGAFTSPLADIANPLRKFAICGKMI